MADESNSATLQVSGLAPSVTDALVVNMFRTFGPILRAKVDGFGGAHVVFERKTNAYKAIPATNGAVLEGKPITVAMVPKFAKTNKMCRGFIAGICRKGDECKYLHNVAPAVGAAAAGAKLVRAPRQPAATPETAIPSHIQNIPSSLVCRHFARGSCSLGATCRFAHIRGGNAPAAPAPAQPQAAVAHQAPAARATAAATPATAKRPCQFFASGLCKRGEQCAYSHELPAPVAPKPAKKEKKAKPAAAITKTAASAAPVAKNLKKSFPEPVVADASRTCIECEAVGVAKWQCAKCDDSLYCDSCDALVHKSKVMKNHERSELPPVPVVVEEAKNPVCDECEEDESSVTCAQCEVVLCSSCDASVHKFKSLRSHARTPIAKKASAPAPVAAAVVVAKKPAMDVQEPALKKQKVSKTTPVASSPEVPDISYIESIPKYDLTSESESSDEEEDEEDEKEDETMDSDDDDEPPIVANAFPPQSVTNAAPVAAVSAPATQNGELSSESSDDDDDERPVVLAAPVRKAVAAKPVATAAVSSESESSDDEEEEGEQQRAPVAASKPAAESSESESSSDEEEVSKPVVKALAPVVRKAPAAAAPKPKPAPMRAASINPGISTGSSHSLVKRIEAYAESGERETLHLDANLNGFERLLAHDCAERLGLQHVSVGEGLERHITISRR